MVFRASALRRALATAFQLVAFALGSVFFSLVFLLIDFFLS